jgi:4'-phosphopantetheinyl transferase
MSSNTFILAKNEIIYWDIDVENLESSYFSNLYQQLSDSNKSRSSFFIKEKDRNLFITAHYALDFILDKIFQIKPLVLIDINGKPYIKNYPIHFNLSHTENRVLLGFSHQPLGVDIEKINALPDLDLLISHSMHPDEISSLMAIESNHKIYLFYSLWTKKEAIVKAIGIGMGMELNSFSLESLKKDASWQIFELNIDTKYSAAIATQNTSSSLIGYQLRLPATELDIRLLSRTIR